ncbi:hypothetical protein [Streptomyces sp. NPDC002763]|uniref:hypothetical protein n=1 Tax=Streptomyces sp. NPDC002763 TaxID=3154427 RepID=UPI00331FAA0A
MQSPLPRRPKGPSAIAAASASRTAPDPGSEDDSAPEQEPDPSAPPMSAAAAAFAAESAVTPQHTAVTAGPPRVGGERAESESGRSRKAVGTPPDRRGGRAAEATAGPGTETALRPPAASTARRRLPRAVLLTGASVVVATLIGGAFLIGRAADDGTRSPDSASGATPGTAEDGGSYDSTPSLLGPPPPSMSRSASPSASPSADTTGTPSRPPATGAAKGGGTSTHPPAAPSAAGAAAANAGPTQAGSGGSDDDSTSCTSAAGSGAITDYSVCVSSGKVTFQVTFHTSQSYYHVFFNTDGNTATGYRLPYPSPSALGADYMIENGGLYRSRSSDWSWTETATHPKRTVNGSTQTWTLPLSGIGSPAGTQRVEFNAGSTYTPMISFSPK